MNGAWNASNSAVWRVEHGEEYIVRESLRSWNPDEMTLPTIDSIGSMPEKCKLLSLELNQGPPLCEIQQCCE